MLNILGMIVLIIIFFIIIILLIGIKISFEYNKKGSEFEGCLKILIFKKIKIYSLDFPSDENEDDKKENESEIDIRKIIDLSKPCFKELIEYLKSVLKVIEIKKLENHFIFGLDSYVDTGKYIGIIWGVLSIINSISQKFKLSAEPSFNGSTFEGYGVNDIEIYPLKLIIPTARLISKKDIRKLIKGVINE